MVFFKLLLEIITKLEYHFKDWDDINPWTIILLYIITLILLVYLLATVWDEEDKKKDKEEEDSDDKKAMVKDWFIDFFN